ncbi:25302_t:CDS:2, partial [Racocetra persica]
ALNDNTTSSEILECEFESYSECETSIATITGSESGIEISSNNTPKRTRKSNKTSKFQQRNSKLFSPLKNQVPEINNKVFNNQLTLSKLPDDNMQNNRIQEDQLDIMQENHIQENRDDSIITQNCPEIRKPFETITSNIILQIPPTEKPITLNLNLTFGK